jgi:two-component sensor histidine kinase
LSSDHVTIDLTGTKRSFGTRLIETLGKQLKGDVRLTYEPSGFVYALDVPLASLTSSAAE